ncbi:MAG: polyprenyl synthetase family protein [Cryobacterium sp.]|nr:polyprenyl synthetase family protein [Cryobacterium sp.]
MAESTRLVDLVQDGINRFLDEREPELRDIADELTAFTHHARALLRGGKRFRALFCYWGWQSTQISAGAFDPLADHSDPQIDAVVHAAVALELFHAAALVHDDIIDNSDTRRGGESIHRTFETIHRDGGWSGSAESFGRSAAILLGDILLAWSDEAFDEGLARTASSAARAAARGEHHRMRTEVMLGQYLDIVNEQAWRTYPESEQLPRAHRVILYKSAKYSIEAPLAIGAALGGGTAADLAALRAFGLPLGIAYQLRDDLLGVFGDPSMTGKPSGDDLREGKRTVLVALARAALPPNATRLFDELLGERDLSDLQVRMLQDTIKDSGAIESVERIIVRNVEQAKSALESATITARARMELLNLAESATARTA